MSIDRSEIEDVIKRENCSKVPGVDDFRVEELQAVTRGLGTEVLLRLFREVRHHEVVCMEWKLSFIIPIYRKKDKLDCQNYKSISFLCHSSKIFSSITLQRIKGKTEEILAEGQYKFRANRNAIDQMFPLRQLTEKCEKFGKGIDFRKAFDSI